MSQRPPALPTVTPTGDMLLHMSAKARTRVLDTVFQMVGGEERLAHEATKNSEGYWNFMRLWGKGVARVNSTEHSVNSHSVEDLWAKLDERKKAGATGSVVDAEFTDVTPED